MAQRTTGDPAVAEADRPLPLLPPEMRGLVRVQGMPFPVHGAHAPGGTRVHAQTSFARVTFLSITYRCTVCGRPLGLGARWGWTKLATVRPEGQQDLPDPGDGSEPRVAGIPVKEGESILVPEGAAHEPCLLYSMAECPFLRSPNWRYKIASDLDLADPEHPANNHRARGEVSGPKLIVRAECVNTRLAELADGSARIPAPMFTRDVVLFRANQAAIRERLATFDGPDVEPDAVVDALQRCDDIFLEMAMAALPLYKVPANQRNKPCRCGSGRKTKVCHPTNDDLLILEDELRRGWATVGSLRPVR